MFLGLYHSRMSAFISRGKKKISLLNILALEQECVHSPYRKQLSISSLVRPQGPGLHFIKLRMGGRGGTKCRKKSSPCNAMFSYAHSNTLCLWDSLQRLPSKHAIGQERRDSALPTALHEGGQDPATEMTEHYSLLFVKMTP